MALHARRKLVLWPILHIKMCRWEDPAMKIMFLNKAPRNAVLYDVEKIENLLKS